MGENDAIEPGIGSVIGGDDAFTRLETTQDLQLFDIAAAHLYRASMCRVAVRGDHKDPLASALLQKRTDWNDDGRRAAPQREFALHRLARQQAFWGRPEKDQIDFEDAVPYSWIHPRDLQGPFTIVNVCCG